MYMNIFYYSLMLIHSMSAYFNLHSKRTMYMCNIYFYIMSALVWEPDLVVTNTLIYLFTDLFSEKISRKLTKFTIYHHTVCIIALLMNKYDGTIDSNIIKITCIQELSTIPLALFYMGYIPKPIYNLIFSYTFIFVRLICYNYAMYNLYMNDIKMNNNTTIACCLLMNLTNIGVILQMRLVQKLFGGRAAIEYLFRSK